MLGLSKRRSAESGEIEEVSETEVSVGADLPTATTAA
jgi:hypothetical protein